MKTDKLVQNNAAKKKKKVTNLENFPANTSELDNEVSNEKTSLLDNSLNDKLSLKESKKISCESTVISSQPEQKVSKAEEINEVKIFNPL